MRDRRRPLDPSADPGAQELTATIGRLGDRATSAPDWPDLVARHRDERHRRPAWLAGPRPWPVVAGAALAVLVLVGGLGWALVERGDDGTVDLDTIDRSSDGAPDGSDGSGPPGTGSDGATPDGTAVPDDLSRLVLGPSRCVDGEPEPFAAAELVGIQADLDGDGRMDSVGAVSDVGGDIGRGPVIWVSLADGTWVLTELTSDQRPPIQSGSAWAVDLGGGPADELVVQFPGAGTLDRVEIYRLGDCAVEMVPTAAGEPAEFPVAAHSSACQDVCNVGLVCLPGEGLLATETSPVDPADPRGDHTTTEVRWAYRDGSLIEEATERGTLPSGNLPAAGFRNEVTCDAEGSDGDLPAGDGTDQDLLAVADALGVELLVAEVGPAGQPGERGLVVTGGEVLDLDPDGYRVTALYGDALATAPAGSFVEDGPRLDLDGRPIDCPSLPGWSGGAMVGTPVDLGRGWGIEVDSGVAAEPLDLPDGLDGPWWPIERQLVDCTTGERSDLAPVTAASRPDGSLLADQETFLQIATFPARTMYLAGGEGFLTVATDDGHTFEVPGTTNAWAVTPDGSGLVWRDLDTGTIGRIDIVSGRTVWTTPADPSSGFPGVFQTLGDRLLVSDPLARSTALIDLGSGAVVVGPVEHPGFRITDAR